MANKYALLKLPGPKVIDQAVALANWQLFADSLVVGLPLLWSIFKILKNISENL